MRLKVAPGDFRVRESLDFVEDRNGPYFIHRLRKEKLDTLEAIRIVAAEARVDRVKIAFAAGPPSTVTAWPLPRTSISVGSRAHSRADFAATT